MEPIAGLASLALIEGDMETAMEYVEIVLGYLENGGSLDGTEEPLRICWSLWNILQQAEDARAIGLLAGTYRQLQERAESISDKKMRLRENDCVAMAWAAVAEALASCANDSTERETSSAAE